MSYFSHSDIVGYSSHLALKHVKLPLKYFPPDLSTDWSENFKNKTSCSGGFLDLACQDGNFFKSIQYGVSSDLLDIDLTPVLVDEATALGVLFQNIVIHLPHPIISKSNVAFQFVSQTADEPYILIDMIDVNYLLITLKIELSDFLAGNSNHRLSLDTFSEWVNISVPYSFELRSAPFFMKALNPENLVVSMKDGGLLHFKRHSPLSAIDIFNFTESVPLISFNLMGGLFKSSNVDSFADGISANAVVDIIQTSDNEFAALSIDKRVKLWDLTSHKQSGSVSLQDGHSGSSTWLTNVPAKYLQVFEFQSKRYLAILFALETTNTPETKESGYGFRFFEISSDGRPLRNELPSFAPEVPLKVDSNSNPFKIQDFQFTATETLSCFILWKSNTYSFLTKTNLEILTGVTTSITFSVSNREFQHQELSSHLDEDYFQNIVFNSGCYDDKIVRTALSIFKDKSGSKFNAAPDFNLRQSFVQIIDSTSKSSGISKSSLWYKVALICEEFKRLSHEASSLLVASDVVLISQAHGLGVFREAHFYESFLENSNSSGLSKLLNAVSTKISTNTHRRLIRDLPSLSAVNAETVTRFASEHLCGKLSDDEITAIMEELASIPDVVEEIKLVIGSDFSADYVVDELSAIKVGEGFGLLSKLLSVNIFKSIKVAHERILHDLLVLLLLCEVNDSILEFLNLVIRRLSRYEIVEQVFDISFEETGSESRVESRGVSQSENSIYWAAIVKKNPGLIRLLSRRYYNIAFDYYCDYALGTCYSEYILDVILELINRNEGDLVLRTFILKLDTFTPINKFLIGIIHLITNSPQKFFDIFMDYSTFEAVNNEQLSSRLLKGIFTNSRLKSFLSSIFIGSSDDTVVKSKYYHALSKICSLQAQDAELKPTNASSTQEDFLKGSLKFQKIAIEILEKSTSQDTSVARLATQYYHDLFNDSLEIMQYEEAIASLSKLNSLLPRNDFKTSFTRLVKTLITHHKVKMLFLEEKNELFIKNYLLVDTILLELANNDLILSNALKCYEFLYSWRLFGGSQAKKLGDKRGAIEALYIFITRFRMEQDNLGSTSNDFEDFKQFKLKVLELYMIIINCLKTFESEDDQWLVKRNTSRRLGYVQLRELNYEYLRWLRELEEDLSK